MTGGGGGTTSCAWRAGVTSGAPSARPVDGTAICGITAGSGGPVEGAVVVAAVAALPPASPAAFLFSTSLLTSLWVSSSLWTALLCFVTSLCQLIRFCPGSDPRTAPKLRRATRTSSASEASFSSNSARDSPASAPAPFCFFAAAEAGAAGSSSVRRFFPMLSSSATRRLTKLGRAAATPPLWSGARSGQGPEPLLAQMCAWIYVLITT
mmetsp:Transcript_13155/g.30742  ORF Transcript_13155/g.30742 Transcript_13155/m.30742 type:complete len:209 (+) Transcript_13155:272-898(+)